MIAGLLAEILAHLKLSQKGSKCKALLISNIMFEINRALYLELQTYNLRSLTFYVNGLKIVCLELWHYAIKQCMLSVFDCVLQKYLG